MRRGERASELIAVSPKLQSEADGRHQHVLPLPECFPPLRAASASAAKMLRPALGSTLFLPVALWIFNHASHAQGALPTTRKLLSLIFFGPWWLMG